MNKCYKCGQEFEGDFCTQCGSKLEESKICPACGTVLGESANFCNKCGHRFNADISDDTEQQHQTEKVNPNNAVSFEFGEKFYRVTNKILKWSPCVLFLLFAVLNFVFMSLSAYSVFGMDMGSIYKITDEDYKLSATVLIAVCSLSAFYAFTYPFLRGKRTKIAHSIAFVLYVLVLAVSCAMHIQIKKGDWTVESATKLLIAFSVVFAFCTAAAISVDTNLTKRNRKYADAKNAIRDNSQPTFAQKAVYAVKTWYKANKKKANGTVIGVCSAAVVCVLVFAVIIPLATNIFRIGKVSRINLGDSKEQVIKVLGKPKYGNVESNAWQYFGKELTSLMNRQEELNKQVDNLEDLEQLGELMEEQAKLDEQIAKTTDKYIAVSFDSNEKVSSVTLDAAYGKSTQNKPKEVKSVTVGNKNTVDVADISNNTVKVQTHYTDGSYKLSVLPSDITASDFGKTNKYFPSSATLSWKDGWGSYSTKANICESKFNFTWSYNSSNYELQLDGNLPSKRLYDFFQIENTFPWIESKYEIKSIFIGKNTAYFPELKEIVPNFNGSIKVDSENSFFQNKDGTIINPEGKLIYVSANTDAEFIKRTQWYEEQPDGVVYFNDILIGYRGEMPANYDLVVKDGTTTILKHAFYNQINITSVTIPDSVTSICSNAFDEYSKLANINYLGTIDDWLKIDGLYNLMKYDTSNKTFSLNGQTVTELVIPNTVTSIPSYAFYSTNITSVTIPDSVTSIDYAAFSGCSDIANINYLGTINDWCRINGLYNLMKYSSSNKTLVIDGKEITGELVIPNTVTNIPLSAFSGTKITSIIIPSTITSIGENTFLNCSSFTSITIPDSVTSIGENAFRGCNSLANINYLGTIDDWCKIEGLNYLMQYGTRNKTFSLNGQAVTELVMPNTVTSIPSYAFYGTNITSVTFEENSQCTSIGSYAFYGCEDITTATIPTIAISSIPKTKLQTVVITSGSNIDSSAFRGCSSITSITIPDSVTSIGSYAFDGCRSLANINYLGTIDDWCKIDGLYNLMRHGTSNKTLVIDSKEITGELVIPNTVTSIPSYAFYYCKNITSVTIPDSVTSIGDYAFDGCNSLANINYLGTIDDWFKIEGLNYLMQCGTRNKTFSLNGQAVTELVIPNTVTSIPSYAFYYCKNITSVTIPDSVTSIGSFAFRGCSSLTSITIPDSVTSIGSYAFRDCSSLTSVTIGNSVTSIDGSAFDGCINLTDINFNGTVAQWKAIAKGSYWHQNVPAEKVICTDGEVAL